ncbi:hypothetical protein FEM54_19495 [Pseudomonas edaphica]|uniref:Secreted protein n=1 Tax=Pseudomonas edaphica TaxID=2006980 RepID=A0ABY2U1X1_9PSED|nr:hypothetical protein FEM54_19495 [Pseudomonas edaphica]
MISHAARFVWATPSKCGSWLACDGAVSVDAFVTDTPPSQASQLPQSPCWSQVMGAGLNRVMSLCSLCRCAHVCFLPLATSR